MHNTTATETVGAQASATITAIREKLLAGAAPVGAFAEATGKTVRTISAYISQGLPVIYVGRTPYVVIDAGIDWLRTRRTRHEPPAPRGRGRPRKAA